MNPDSPTVNSQLLPQDDATNSASSDDYNQSLALNPGAPERAKRSGKLCLWVMSIPIILYIGFMVYLFYKNLFGLKLPHKHLYYNEKSPGCVVPGCEVRNRSQVVRPMFMKDSKFDIVASVWVRDDSTRRKEDAALRIDGEGRPETLIFTERVFRGLDVDGKMRSTDVQLRIPINHFKQTNLSNYDLRASFVLVHSEGKRPAWLKFVKKFTTWKPHTMASPAVRKHDGNPTLADEIYDSFGITIPLIQFHNITRKEHFENVEAREFSVKGTPGSNQDEKGTETSQSAKSTATKSIVDTRRNSFKLEFIGDKQPVTEYHPYVVTRTHLRIMKEDQPFQLIPYLTSQKQVANNTCASTSGEHTQNPEWYECHRTLRDNGVFETAVQLGVADDSSESRLRPEWLYAPYLSAMLRAAGPKDLVPIPVDREGIENPNTLSSDENNLTITWRLTFSSRAAKSLLQFEGATLGLEPVYNLTEAEPMLQKAQYFHDYFIGLFDNIDENTHPRRNAALAFISVFIRLVCWVLTVGYWYTRTSTAGISRLGTALLCLAGFIGKIEGLAGIMVSGTDPSQVSVAWVLAAKSLIDLIKPLVMLIAIMRLEFSWLTKKNSRGENGKKKSWIPSVRMAKATHSERTSERVEARVPRIATLLLFAIAFATSHYLITPNSFILSPEMATPPEKRLLGSYFSNVPSIVNLLETLTTSSFLTGHILQLLMNYLSRTYAGDYKTTTLLWLIARVTVFLDLLPYFVGARLRARGVTVKEGVVLLITVVNLFQAARYQYAKSLDGEDDE